MSGKGTPFVFAGVFVVVLTALALSLKDKIGSIRDNTRVDWVLETNRTTLADILKHGGPTAIVTVGSIAPDAASNYAGKATIVSEQKLQETSRNEVCAYLKRINSVVYAAAARDLKRARSHAEFYSVICSRPVYVYSAPETK